MAQNEIGVIISVNTKKLQAGLNNATRGIKNFANKTKSFVANNALLLTGALTAVGAGLAKSVQAYGVQEQAIAQLEQSLKNQGNFTEAASQDLQKYAASLQQVTTFGDETILKAQSLIASFGFEGEALKSLTKATADLAAAKGFDLVQAADLVSKSVGSTTNALTRYGIEVKGAAGSTDRAANAVENINKLFGGQAETIRDTTLGQVTALGNSFGDLQETIGSFVAGEGTSLITALEKWVKNFDDSLKIIKEFKDEVGGFGPLLASWGISFQINIIDRILFLGPILKLFGIDIDDLKAKAISLFVETDKGMKNQINNSVKAKAASEADAKAQIKAEKDKADALAKAEEEKRKEQQKTDDHMANVADIRIARWIEEKQLQLEAEQEFKDAMMLTTEAWTRFAQETASAVFTQFGDGVADMILESRKFSDVIKSIWKDLARSVISMIARMIAKWIAFQVLTGGGAGGFGAANKFFGGFAQHGGIIGEPSLITGMKSGQSIIAGEAGPEAIVPINSGGGGGLKVTPTGSIGGGGGMNLTVNISGQFLEAGPAKWSEMFRNKIMPEVRRFTMVSPTSQFIRRRGSA